MCLLAETRVSSPFRRDIRSSQPIVSQNGHDALSPLLMVGKGNSFVDRVAQTPMQVDGADVVRPSSSEQARQAQCLESIIDHRTTGFMGIAMTPVPRSKGKTEFDFQGVVEWVWLLFPSVCPVMVGVESHLPNEDIPLIKKDGAFCPRKGISFCHQHGCCDRIGRVFQGARSPHLRAGIDFPMCVRDVLQSIRANEQAFCFENLHGLPCRLTFSGTHSIARLVEKLSYLREQRRYIIMLVSDPPVSLGLMAQAV